MANDVDTLATALHATTDDMLKEHPDLAPWRPPVGITPRLSDAELVTLAMMRTARRQYPAHGPAVPPGLHGSLVNEIAAQQPFQTPAPHLPQWLDFRSMALSCTDVNRSPTPQPRTPEKAHLPPGVILDGVM
jgi:hypothetical protein